MTLTPRFRSFQEFWPHYVREHQSVGCRALHFAGLTLAIACIVAALVLTNYWWLVLAPIAGYGISWIGHFFVERNQPAAFRYPLWSFRADARMWRLIALRRMQREVEAAVEQG
jgi:hypothetical protein